MNNIWSVKYVQERYRVWKSRICKMIIVWKIIDSTTSVMGLWKKYDSYNEACFAIA